MGSTFYLFSKLLQTAQGIKVLFWACLKSQEKVSHWFCQPGSEAEPGRQAEPRCPGACGGRAALVFCSFGLFAVFWSSWGKVGECWQNRDQPWPTCGFFSDLPWARHPIVFYATAHSFKAHVKDGELKKIHRQGLAFTRKARFCKFYSVSITWLVIQMISRGIINEVRSCVGRMFCPWQAGQRFKRLVSPSAALHSQVLVTRLL